MKTINWAFLFLMGFASLWAIDEKPAKPVAIAGIARGAYFGQPLPGETPVPFAPEVLNSISPWVEATDFSPDGSQFLLAVGDASYSSAKLYHSKCVDGDWTPFVAAPFAADFTFSHEPHFSTNGTHLTFTGKKASGQQDIWILRYVGDSWGVPAALPAPLNSDGKEWRGSTTADGVVYFGSERERPGVNQLYKGYRDANQQLVVEKLPPPMNTNSYEGDPCVAPDGRFLVFYSARDGQSADLYVSFRDGQGGWKSPVILGPDFNSASDEYGAHLSADGRYLFFTRHSAQGNRIYWVAVTAIDKLDPALEKR